MDQVSSRPEPKPIHNRTPHPPSQCDPILSLAPIPIYPSIPARFAHLYRVEICLKCHHAPFPKSKITQPPPTEPLIGALRSVITTPYPFRPKRHAALLRAPVSRDRRAQKDFVVKKNRLVPPKEETKGK
ncbi:hypothetical protein B0T18DRAFT_158739 [Schizothecium vesticola]|uniref:Uncharacterized protein n=1 Tax=Schizothecium vesticola TaxID=314040 RepID=A0AA40EWP0_9PEZI|nr:hypothetical protein B0T18DRAFT_158739 [Schizothecium vesticola]